MGGWAFENMTRGWMVGWMDVECIPSNRSNVYKHTSTRTINPPPQRHPPTRPHPHPQSPPPPPLKKTRPHAPLVCERLPLRIGEAALGLVAKVEARREGENLMGMLVLYMFIYIICPPYTPPHINYKRLSKIINKSPLSIYPPPCSPKKKRERPKHHSHIHTLVCTKNEQITRYNPYTPSHTIHSSIHDP